MVSSAQTGNGMQGAKPEIEAFHFGRDTILKGPEPKTRADHAAIAAKKRAHNSLVDKADLEWVKHMRDSGRFDKPEKDGSQSR